MAEEQIEETPVAVEKVVEKVKAVKKKAVTKAKKPADHPKYADMVREALGTLKERGGSSRQAILKYIAQNYKLGAEEKMVNAHLKMALKSGVKSGTLKQSKGIGASGSFKLGTDKDAKEVKEGSRSPAKDRAQATKKSVKPKAKSAAKPKAKASPIKKSPEKKTALKVKSPKKEIKKAPVKAKAQSAASPKAAKKVNKPAAKTKKATAGKGKK